MKPFSVPVSDLLHRPGARRREHLAAHLDGVAMVVSSRVPRGSTVVVDLLLEWVTDGLLATGTVTAPWVGECRRCLEPAGGDLQVEFRELFESTPREGESYRLGHDTVDLEPLVREAVTLDLPLAPLCRPDCRGLCSGCGADLNLGECSCRPEPADGRWSALSVLFDVETPSRAEE